MIDDDDAMRHYNEIKEAFRLNFNTFDDLLQKMGQPAMITEGNSVTFRDFEAVVRSIPQGLKYSIQQLKNVFMSYAQGVTANDASIRTVEFKDKFFPGIHWKRTNNETSGVLDSRRGPLSTSQRSETSGTASIHVDNILAGLKHEDAKKADTLLKDKEDKYKPSRGGLKQINEDLLERQSQSSVGSQGIDDILTRGRDPRKSK